MKSRLSALFAVPSLLGLLAACGGAPGNTDTFDRSGLVSGSSSDRNRCADPGHDAWVEVDGRGDCLRYYDGGSLDGVSPEVIVWLHGDLVEGTWRGNGAPPSYRVVGDLPSGPAELDGKARRNAGRGRMPFVYLGRPGAFGSSGSHKDYRLPREHQLVNAALDVIKARYEIERFHLAGHSGGGHVVASLLPLRDDIGCVLLSSSILAVKVRQSMLGVTRRPVKLTDYFDPYDVIDRIPHSAGLRIFIVGDRRDRRVPFFSQTLYHDGLKMLGYDVHLAEAAGAPPDYHSYGAAIEGMVMACANGQPDDAILAWAGYRP